MMFFSCGEHNNDGRQLRKTIAVITIMFTHPAFQNTPLRFRRTESILSNYLHWNITRHCWHNHEHNTENRLNLNIPTVALHHENLHCVNASQKFIALTSWRWSILTCRHWRQAYLVMMVMMVMTLGIAMVVMNYHWYDEMNYIMIYITFLKYKSKFESLLTCPSISIENRYKWSSQIHLINA